MMRTGYQITFKCDCQRCQMPRAEGSNLARRAMCWTESGRTPQEIRSIMLAAGWVIAATPDGFELCFAPGHKVPDGHTVVGK